MTTKGKSVTKPVRSTASKKPGGQPSKGREPEVPGRAEVVLELGFEGGSFTLLRSSRSDGTFRYSKELNQVALRDLLDGNDADGLEGIDASGTTLREVAVELLTQGFLCLVPIVVHRDLVPLLTALADVARLTGSARHEYHGWRDVFARGEWRRD